MSAPPPAAGADNDVLTHLEVDADPARSNHGGRQLDRPPVPLRELPAVRAAVGPSVPLILDSGITSGGDVVAALALGADFTMIGRSYLYGLMAGGERGVDRVLAVLARELTVTLQLLGVGAVDELGPEHARLLHP